MTVPLHAIPAEASQWDQALYAFLIACLSSGFRFLVRMGLVASHPCDLVERPRTSPSSARSYSADEVRQLLGVIPDTIRGRRDRAILLILAGRRRSEVMGMTAGDIGIEDSTSTTATEARAAGRADDTCHVLPGMPSAGRSMTAARSWRR